ncbi:hypothetical protein [Streptomyces sp. ODS28]|uniref:hypothetical protein n=1 Tax=Streptomyces sp. ODS28 TaxID=3136688 RepID=UPI0031EB369F
MPLLAIVLGALLVTDFKGSATRLYGLLARYQRPGMATVGTVRTVGGIAIFVGVGSLAPDLVALLT